MSRNLLLLVVALKFVLNVLGDVLDELGRVELRISIGVLLAHVLTHADESIHEREHYVIRLANRGNSFKIGSDGHSESLTTGCHGHKAAAVECNIFPATNDLWIQPEERPVTGEHPSKSGVAKVDGGEESQGENVASNGLD
jgi:hypothetical protein